MARYKISVTLIVLVQRVRNTTQTRMCQDIGRDVFIYHAVFQMLRQRQDWKFCHIESRGKNNVTSLIKLQPTSGFLHIEPIYIRIHINLLVFKNY